MDRGTAIVLALILAPVSLVIIVALVRGYTIMISMTREHDRRRNRDE